MVDGPERRGTPMSPQWAFRAPGVKSRNGGFAVILWTLRLNPVGPEPPYGLARPPKTL